MVLVNHYTKSQYTDRLYSVLDVGTSNDNVKIIKLSRTYNNPKFYPRKFKNWPDTFDIVLLDNNLLSVRRSDVSVGGWGENLFIDVEYDNINISIVDEKQLLSKQKIPRVIYQTFETLECTDDMFNSIESWKNQNPDYEHYFFDNDKRIEFIQKYFDKKVVDAYLKLIPGAFKADLWRYCVLYVCGGVYVDSDMICLTPLRDYILEDDEFVLARDDPMSKSYLCNGFIAVSPLHPFLQKQIDEIVKNIESKVNCFYLDITGPGLLGKTVNKILERDVEHEYGLGENIVKNYTFKLFFHDWKTKTIKIGGEDGKEIIITEYPNKQNDMNKINNISYYHLCQNNMIYQIIPRQIYYTTKDSFDIKNYMIESFTNKNKYWNMNYFDDNLILKFLSDNNNIFISELEVDILAYYKTLINGGEKSDLWRYCVIYLMGGVYTDSDTFCNIELDKWIKHHDLILGIEAFLDLDVATNFSMDKIGFTIGNKVICVCNWTFAASPRHIFFKLLLQDICLYPILNDILNNTGPGRITKHAIKYFSDCNILELEHNNIIKNKSILYNINKFGSNQLHSNSYKNFTNPLNCNLSDIYVVHLFEGTWRYSHRNKNIKTYKYKNNIISHNLTIIKNNKGFLGVGRIDIDTTRTKFMECIGDCRSLLEIQFDNNFNILNETEHNITNINKISKFEDFRFFEYCNKFYISVSYIDDNFNTKVAILDSLYKYLGDVNIDVYNKVSFTSKSVIWEKNWLFFEKDNELYFIYSTTPKYILYKCTNFNSLKFSKCIDIDFPLNNDVPDNEKYFTSYIGTDIKIATGGSTNPIYIKDKNIYLYLIHTKIYNEFKYNHYAVILSNDLIPIKLYDVPLFNSKFIQYKYFFIMTMCETDNYLIISGGIDDKINFVWELAKEQIFKKLEIF
jgi:mannosyltransferase OCH1-like enzyme